MAPAACVPGGYPGGAIETVGDGVAIQRVSQRRPLATDFRVVQCALNADGVGNFLSGIAGTLPNTTYSSSISLAEVTGIAARRVGVIIGAIFVAVAFFPKVAALLIAIPAPVAAAYITVLLALLFVQGMKIVIQDGVDHRKAVVAGLAFWVGVGFQNQWVFAEQLGEGFLGVLLGNGMTAGALVAIIMMVFMELTGPRPRRLEIPLDSDALPKLVEFVRKTQLQRKTALLVGGESGCQHVRPQGRIHLLRPAYFGGKQNRLRDVAEVSVGSPGLLLPISK